MYQTLMRMSLEQVINIASFHRIPLPDTFGSRHAIKHLLVKQLLPIGPKYHGHWLPQE